MSTYADLLAAKAQLNTAHGFDPSWIPEWMFPFQAALLGWSVRMGRAALFADCGLGKTPTQLAWAENVRRETGRPVLVVTPLAVSYQTAAEAQKFGIDAAISRTGRPAGTGITVTNYDRLELFDSSDYGGVVCDESSAIKAFDGSRRALVTEFMRTHRYRLLCTATAAPNDYIELGTSSEALGYLGHVDMLGRFFTNRQRTIDQKKTFRNQGRDDGGWRFKGHAEGEFWRWVASWARACRRPSDLGFSDDGFDLPPLEHRQHVVEARVVRDGQLFDLPAQGLHEEREEQRRTITERCEKAAEVLDGDELGIAWCHLNDEGRLLANLIPGAVEVAGSGPADAKEEKLAAFSRGEIRVLVTKPSIAGWGLNWQHCHRMTFFPSHSYEQYYQAVRRCWRFGQKQPVTVDVITTEGGANVLANLQRKADAADAMFAALVAHMRDAADVNPDVHYDQEVQVPAWVA